MNSKLHIPIIESLRGVAALAVAVFHIMNAPTGFITDKAIRQWGTRGAFGVEMFFIISGVVITLQLLKLDFTWKKLPRFMVRRSIRIEPTYLSAIALVLCYIGMRQWLIDDSKAWPSLLQIVQNVFYLVPFMEDAKWLNAVYWTLGIELQYYLGIALLIPLLSKGKWHFRGIMVILMGTFLLLHESTPKDIIISQLPYFMLGIGIAFYKMGRVKWPEMLLMSLITLSAIYGMSPFGLWVALFTWICILTIPSFNPRVSKFLGRQSYSLYLIHGTIGCSTVNLLMPHFTAPVEKVLIVLAATAVSIIGAEIMYRMVEAPSHRWSKRVKVR